MRMFVNSSNYVHTQRLSIPGDQTISQVTSKANGKHFLALSSSGSVFTWGCGENGRLGHGDTRYVIQYSNSGHLLEHLLM